MNVISCSTVSGPPTPLGHSAYEFRVPSSNIAPLSLSYGPVVKVTALPRIASGFLLVWSRALPSNFTNNNGDGYLSNPCIATNRVNKGYVRKSNVCRQYPIAKSNSLSRAIFLPAVLFKYFYNHTSTNTNYKQAQIFHSEWRVIEYHPNLILVISVQLGTWLPEQLFATTQNNWERLWHSHHIACVIYW